jgi:uncharacterized protein YjeT (DUF2065 family)
MSESSGLTDLTVALGLVLAFEGACYAVAPNFMKDMLSRVGELSDDALRWGGLAALVAGVAVVWAVRG